MERICLLQSLLLDYLKLTKRNNKESYIDLSQRSGPTNIMKSYLSRSFVARNADITNILRTFVNDKKKIDFKNSYNIINLYGKEGAGKTEFALQLGKKLRPIFNHGVYYFSLLELQLSIYQGDLHKLMEATFGNEFKNRKQGYFVENMCIILDDIDCYLNGQQVLNFKETIQEISEGKSTLILVSGSMLDDKEEQQNEDSGNTGGINSSRLNLKKKTKNRKVLVSLIKNARPKSEFFSYQIEELVDENFTAIKVLLTSLLDIHFKYKNDQQKEELQNKMRNELVSLGGNLKFVISKFLILLKTDNNGVDIQDEKEVDLYNKFNQNDQEFQKNLNLTKTDKILLSSTRFLIIIN
ncbi:P-loop containing nucleoside triphosphate hydrolase [Pseudocohnilembus persalinus]|uniref:p-loop containing nucleoside triphosphate hydrolase n=1 Tax=Pseudocohnilembus persalinus TaxID=266149 RepID=A0A0V0QMV2_PSEPJ|nr:P-loop containing nucleoside triphosphate hydrolase [Pseudocohnilembus persalinus]|eukprot:KRX03689.1 P-loop containing nucleoside triphosphate hydrolase [Pseudocohnilembus persalinus]